MGQCYSGLLTGRECGPRCQGWRLVGVEWRVSGWVPAFVR